MNNQTPKYTLFGNYGLWNKPFWQTGLFYMIISLGIILICFCIGYGIYCIAKKRRSQAKKPSWQDAYRGIVALSTTYFETPEHLRSAYHQLTQYMKTYIHYRYTCDAHGMTDAELIIYLQRKNVMPHLVEHMRVILDGSAGIRFANETADRLSIKDYMNRGLAFIKETQPRRKENKRNA